MSEIKKQVAVELNQMATAIQDMQPIDETQISRIKRRVSSSGRIINYDENYFSSLAEGGFYAHFDHDIDSKWVSFLGERYTWDLDSFIEAQASLRSRHESFS